MKNNIQSLAFLVFMFIISHQAINAQKKTGLNELAAYALKNSHDIRKAEMQVEEAKYMRKEVLGKGLPQAEFTGTYSRMNLPSISLSPEIISALPEEIVPLLSQLGNISALYTASAGVQVTQLIYSQSYLDGLKSARKAGELYSFLKDKTGDDVIEELANTYYQTLSLMFQKNTVEKSLLNLNELYRIVNLSYKSDMTTETSVNRLRVTITNLEAGRANISNIIDNLQNYIKALAGMPADSVIVPDSSSYGNLSSVDLKKPFTAEELPSYLAMHKQYEISGLQVKTEKDKYLPVVAAYGQFNLSSYSSEASLKALHNMNTIGLRMSLPILSSGSTRARITQARLRMDQLNENMIKTKDLLAVNYNNALSDYQSALKLLEVQTENRKLALDVYRKTLSLYKEGMASMTEVLNVNSDFLQAENSFNQQALKCRLAEIKILKSTGSLSSIANNR